MTIDMLHSTYQLGLSVRINQVLVDINQEFYRPAEVDILLGDSTPARKELGWNPKTSFSQLVKKMVDNDIDYYYS
jgi:GDPmannose 4,6-dehydratase